MLIERNGDLLKASEVNIITHCCNIQGKMGAGIALQIRKLFPANYIAFMKDYREGNAKCGEVLFVDCNGKIIANVYAEKDIYPVGKCHLDYMEFAKGLKQVANYAKQTNLTVGIPYGIGCGLAGGDWDTVYKMLRVIFDGVTCYIYKLN